MLIRYNEVEKWSKNRRLPKKLRKRILEAEIQNWITTRGMNEEEFIKNMPEDIQRDLTRHQFFSVIKKVQLFAVMDNPILDAICKKLKRKIYLKNSIIMDHGDLIKTIVFIVHGKLEIKDINEIRVHISDGDAFGEELLLWCLQRLLDISTDGEKLWLPEERFLSTKTVTSLTDVVAFTVEAIDLEEVLTRFSKYLHTPRIEDAIRRYEMLGRLHEESGSNQEAPEEN